MVSRSLNLDIPPLRGLVLAGGRGRRMGRDKGLLQYAEEPAARRAWRLLNSICADARVSVRPDQVGVLAYAQLPLVVDGSNGRGPVTGILSAWMDDPNAAWLVLAVDMPLVDTLLLTELVRGRDATKLATAFQHPDGTLEPLCTIWEPKAHEVLSERAASERFSLRDALEFDAIETLLPSEPERLVGVDSPGLYAQMQRKLDRSASSCAGPVQG